MIDNDVRYHIYAIALRTGAVPTGREIAAELNVGREAVLQSFRRLAEARMLVLQPGSGEILMAPPFSAVPTPFVVEAGEMQAYANCIWDALGVPAMLGRDARIRTSCGDCGAGAEVRVEGGEVRGEGVVHFAVPARDWWKDVVFT